MDQEIQPKIYSVGEFLDEINVKICDKALVCGEISKISNSPIACYFSLKDPKNGDVLDCLIWQNVCKKFGISLKEGLAVKVLGSPGIYKPQCRFNFKVDILEMTGEGILQKQYEDLKKKLEKEGIFAEDRKKAIIKFPKKIGLITSKFGDAIHDFNVNLVKAGLEIVFKDSRVEGLKAVLEVSDAIRYFNNCGKNEAGKIDAIAIVRGGGSWESLQAFNNEAVCRAVAESQIPVLCGIGHEKDVPLVCLVADKSVSTPTAAAKFLSAGWESARKETENFREKIISRFERDLKNKRYSADAFREKIIGRFQSIMQDARHKVKILSQRLADINPQRQLEKGYSLIFKEGKLVKSVKKLKRGDEVDFQLKDGKAQAEIL
ncbi:MAG: exodeoxyribonuclease VII large subunit [bacterium]